MKYLGAALIFFGILLIFGAAGASDQGLLPFDRIVVQVMIGLVVIGAGVLLARITMEMERINKRKDGKK